jgi:hypothetical protein
MAGIFEGTAPPNVSSTTTTGTTLPSWFDTAQQNIASQAQGAVPQPGQAVAGLEGTLAQNAISQVGSPTSAFKTAGQAAMAGQGPQATADAAGTFLGTTFNPSTGQWEGSGALGSMFNAQNKQFEQFTAPQLTTGADVGALGTGQFGSGVNRNTGQSAVIQGLLQLQQQQGGLLNTAQQNALNSAIQSHQADIQGATAGANIGAQDVNALTQLGQLQQQTKQAEINAPLTNISNLANVIGTLRAPTSTSQTYTGPGSVYGPSVFQQLAGLGSGLDTLGGGALSTAIAPGISALGTALGGGLSGLIKSGAGALSGLFGGSSTSTPLEDYYSNMAEGGTVAGYGDGGQVIEPARMDQPGEYGFNPRYFADGGSTSFYSYGTLPEIEI